MVPLTPWRWPMTISATWLIGTTRRRRSVRMRSRLLAFCRWLAAEEIDLEAVTTDVLLRLSGLHVGRRRFRGRPGPNVVRMDGRRADGYAPATVNHRLAAISGLFGFRSHARSRRQEPGAREAERREGCLLGSGAGCSRTWPVGRDSAQRCGSESPGDCLVRWTATRSWLWWGACGPGGTGRSRG